jgi:hypothetical protein
LSEDASTSPKSLQNEHFDVSVGSRPGKQGVQEAFVFWKLGSHQAFWTVFLVQNYSSEPQKPSKWTLCCFCEESSKEVRCPRKQGVQAALVFGKLCSNQAFWLYSVSKDVPVSPKSVQNGHFEGLCGQSLKPQAAKKHSMNETRGQTPSQTTCVLSPCHA